MFRFSLILALLFTCPLLYGQYTTWIKVADTTMMYKERGEWHFNDGLPDGIYCSYYQGTNKKVVSTIATFKNGVKNGIETRCFFGGDPYGVIPWANGKKHGEEKHFNPNNTLSYSVVYSNGLLNGPFAINWAMGQKNYDGFYKNGFADSIWTYYENPGTIFSDAKDYTISEQYSYRNGIEYLLNCWSKEGIQQVTNGNGIVRYTEGLKTVTCGYKDGLQDGDMIEIRDNRNVYYEDGYTPPDKKVSTYNKGLLVKEVLQYGDTAKEIHEYSYPFPPVVDTVDAWIDQNITDIFYKEIQVKNKPYLHGFNTLIYKNGVAAYAGNYDNGKRIGNWLWHYKNGNQQMAIDYDAGTYTHYDSTGKQVSKIATEYLTVLTETTWYANNGIGDKNFTLSNDNKLTITPAFTFAYNGTLTSNSYLECGKNITSNSGNYYLLGDKLVLSFIGLDSKVYTFKYRIISASGTEIKMVRL